MKGTKTAQKQVSLFESKLKNLLAEVKLKIPTPTVRIQNDGKSLFSVTIEDISSTIENGKITVHKIASYTYITAYGTTYGKALKNLYDKIINPENLILIGSYNNYREKITWNSKLEKFERFTLTENESIKINCIL